MTLAPGEVLTLVAVVLGVFGNAAAIAFLFGRLSERVTGLADRVTESAERFDSDLGRLNAKVDNDVQGRRAVATMQQDVTRLSTKVESLEMDRRHHTRQGAA